VPRIPAAPLIAAAIALSAALLHLKVVAFKWPLLPGVGNETAPSVAVYATLASGGTVTVTSVPGIAMNVYYAPAGAVVAVPEVPPVLKLSNADVIVNASGLIAMCRRAADGRWIAYGASATRSGAFYILIPGPASDAHAGACRNATGADAVAYAGRGSIALGTDGRIRISGAPLDTKSQLGAVRVELACAQRQEHIGGLPVKWREALAIYVVAPLLQLTVIVEATPS